MSSACVAYLLYQINENFGKDCKEICQVLLNNDWVTLKEIKNEIKCLKSNQISEFLQMLINFNVVSFKSEGEHINSFEFNISGAFSFLRSGRYLSLIEHHFDQISKYIIEEFCKIGNLYVTQLFERVKKHFSNEDWVDKVVQATNKLINSRILKVSSISLLKNRSLNIHSQLPKPEKIKESLKRSGSLTCGIKRTYDQLEQGTESWNIQYCLNSACLDILCRNALIIEDTKISLNEDASKLIELLINQLEFGAQSCYNDPVSSGLLRKVAKSNAPDRFENPDRFDELIYLLSQSDDVCYLEQIRNANGTLFRVDFDRIIEKLVTKIIADLVEVVFGTNGLRVFNFLLINDHIEEIAFRNQVLISPALLNTLLPAMLDRGFISKLELSKTKQYYDEPLVSLLFVDLGKAVRCERETCYQSLARIAVRHAFEEHRHQPLLMKLLDMSMKDSSFQTIDGDGAISVVTDKDRETVSRLNQALHKLDAAGIAIDDALLLFDAFIDMKTRRDNF